MRLNHFFPTQQHLQTPCDRQHGSYKIPRQDGGILVVFSIWDNAVVFLLSLSICLIANCYYFFMDKIKPAISESKQLHLACFPSDENRSANCSEVHPFPEVSAIAVFSTVYLTPSLPAEWSDSGKASPQNNVWKKKYIFLKYSMVTSLHWLMFVLLSKTFPLYLSILCLSGDGYSR